MTITLYGIANCDTVRKARTWLADRGIDHVFHDYRKQGADAARIAEWIGHAGLDRVLNRTGTTYRKLPDDLKGEMTGRKAVAVMAEQPSLIRRPIVAYDGGLLVGFQPAAWEAAFDRDG